MTDTSPEADPVLHDSEASDVSRPETDPLSEDASDPDQDVLVPDRADRLHFRLTVRVPPDELVLVGDRLFCSMLPSDFRTSVTLAGRDLPDGRAFDVHVRCHRGTESHCATVSLNHVDRGTYCYEGSETEVRLALPEVREDAELLFRLLDMGE